MAPYQPQGQDPLPLPLPLHPDPHPYRFPPPQSHGASPQGCDSDKAWEKRNRRLAYPEGQARRRYGVSGAGLEGA